MKRLMILMLLLSVLCSCGGGDLTPEVTVIYVTATLTPVPTATPTLVPPTDVPTHTATPVPPTDTAAPPTATLKPTSKPPTDTAVPPTATRKPTPKPPTDTAVPPTATRKPATATPTEPPAQPPSQGCYLFQNLMRADVTVTLTAQDWVWNDTFIVRSGEERVYCLDPGRYTYTLDAPPPWGSTNGELVVNAGDRFLFPIREG